MSISHIIKIQNQLASFLEALTRKLKNKSIKITWSAYLKKKDIYILASPNLSSKLRKQTYMEGND